MKKASLGVLPSFIVRDVQCNSVRQSVSLFHYPSCTMIFEQGSREPETETARLVYASASRRR